MDVVVRLKKADVTTIAIHAMNPDVTVTTYQMRAQADNIAEVIRGYDFVIDGTDNFPAKFLINDACYFEKVPFCHAGILRFYGQLITVVPGQTTCYRCIFPSAPPPDIAPRCEEAGIFGALAGVVGTMQTTEVLKELLGLGTGLAGRLLLYDAMDVMLRTVAIPKNPDCPLCGDNPTITDV